ncbi:MAG: methylated-DNA--[protein]-cysteine S-methyltransferase [Betaproteobacteria bacterium]|nr:methylated-DNA--[protein]-cysteine S-methyltransferase [Betaproteobacteria bacterium]
MNTDYARIELAIRHLQRDARRQPDLAELAAELSLSPFHFQRLFSRWAGVSPKRFLQFLTVDYAKRLLRDSASVLDATYEVGLSSPARLHDHFVSLEAVTPGEYRAGGEGLAIRYGVHAGPFGPMFVAETDRGICVLAFIEERGLARQLAELRREWPEARLMADQAATGATAKRLFGAQPAAGEKLHLLVRGTNFQVQVWQALLRIPEGALCTYGQIAAALGRPQAARAVAGAVASNPVAFLIPCHRVIRGEGTLGGYRWGEPRKAAILAWEQARGEAAS